MRKRGLITSGIIVYLAAVMATAPSTLIDAGLQRVTDERLRLAEAQGTLWSGNGQLEVRAENGQSIARQVQWRILPATLLRGRLTIDVMLGRGGGHFPVTLSPAGIELANVDLTLPAAALGLGIPELAALGLTGELSIHVANLSLSRDSIHGSALLQWHAAGSTLTTVSPLGDYEIQIEADGERVQYLLSTNEGPLRLDGRGSWTHGSKPVFRGTAFVPDAYTQQLNPLLRLIAIERGEGRFELQLK
ncbi:MAG: type II secretion system protein N [Gammaproteobacteria bacterium]